ncbi:MAG: hypothetical protein M1818_002077 [Claussenomyces sp. TS43310]|nr:MAG: hypothetical protein M1818_002077 [Claussenomyces sp. TS43310]
MRLEKRALWALVLVPAAQVSAYTPAPTIETDILAANGFLNLANYQLKQAFSGARPTCTLQNVAVRREWGTLSNEERKDYTDAVLCMLSKPSKFTSAQVPGAKSRFDDFMAIHMNQTLTIHGTFSFLAWHRYFTWLYEQALRDECGYKGYQPVSISRMTDEATRLTFTNQYWNWGKYAFDPINSPIFDGSDYSMSGNGEYEAHNATEGLTTGLNPIPPGPGGGCVKTGPFKNMTVNLGPVTPTLAEPEVHPASSLLAYNPRCLKRDVSQWVSSRYTKDSDTGDLIINYNDISSFQARMQGNFSAGFYGVHTGGHFTIGGDPGGDLFSSPGDPAFYLHHGQIDRTWWIWQNQDMENRKSAIGGTITINNSPPSRNGTLDDMIDMVVNAPPIKISELLSTTEGPFCYIYV